MATEAFDYPPVTRSDMSDVCSATSSGSQCDETTKKKAAILDSIVNILNANDPERVKPNNDVGKWRQRIERSTAVAGNHTKFPEAKSWPETLQRTSTFPNTDPLPNDIDKLKPDQLKPDQPKPDQPKPDQLVMLKEWLAQQNGALLEDKTDSVMNCRNQENILRDYLLGSESGQTTLSQLVMRGLGNKENSTFDLTVESQIRSYKDEITRINGTNRMLQDEVCLQQEEISQLRVRLAGIEERFTDTERMGIRTATMRQEFEILRDQYETMSKKNLDEVRAHLTGEIARVTQELLNYQNALRVESQKTQQVSNDLKRAKLDLSKCRDELDRSQRDVIAAKNNRDELFREIGSLLFKDDNEQNHDLSSETLLARLKMLHEGISLEVKDLQQRVDTIVTSTENLKQNLFDQKLIPSLDTSFYDIPSILRATFNELQGPLPPKELQLRLADLESNLNLVPKQHESVFQRTRNAMVQATKKIQSQDNVATNLNRQIQDLSKVNQSFKSQIQTLEDGWKLEFEQYQNELAQAKEDLKRSLHKPEVFRPSPDMVSHTSAGVSPVQTTVKPTTHLAKRKIEMTKTARKPKKVNKVPDLPPPLSSRPDLPPPLGTKSHLDDLFSQMTSKTKFIVTTGCLVWWSYWLGSLCA